MKTTPNYPDILRLVGLDVDEATEIIQTQHGAREYDDTIDDGGDAPGTYVMRRTCTMPHGRYIRLYYLDTQRIVEDIRL